MVNPRNLTEEQRQLFRRMDTFWKKRFLRLRCHDRCELCNGQTASQMHHKTYQRAGNELPEDLALICRYCHEAIHGIWLGWEVNGNDRKAACDGYWQKTENDAKRIIDESRRRASAIASLKMEDELKAWNEKRDAKWGGDDMSLFNMRRRGT